MSNSGNLTNMRCPGCGGTEEFIIDCLVTMRVTDDAMRPMGGDMPDFDEACYCRCPVCDRDGRVKDFYDMTTMGE